MSNYLKKLSLAGIAASGFLLIAAASGAQTPPQIIPVWNGPAPGSGETSQKEGSLDLTDTRFTPPNPDTLVWNVTQPTLAVFRPAAGKANGTAIIVAPGGGFRVLSYKNEGLRVAQWLADHGVTAFVLKYRLHRMPDDPAEVRKGLDQMLAAAARPPGKAPDGSAAPAPPMPRMEFGALELSAIADGEQAIKLVRSRAKEFGIDPQRIGIIGFSAGGAVAGGASVRAEPAQRPNFVGIIYGGVPGAIPAQAPPAFLAAAADDPLSNGMPDLFARWRASGASAEMHIYAKGQHGFGTAKQGLPVDHWLDVFYAWLEQQGFAPHG
jgi:acetyl esterase/lipase